MDFLEELIKNLYLYLANADGSKTTVIRKRTKDLDRLGDLSFPQNVNSWRGLVGGTQRSGNIFQYLNRNETGLIKFTQSFSMKISKSSIVQDDVHLFFDRTNCYQMGIKRILETSSYGSFDKFSLDKFYLRADVKDDNDVSELRLKIIRDVSENLIQFCNGTICGDEEVGSVKLIFSLKSGNGDDKTSLCGAVLNENGAKDRATTADEYVNKHITHMRLMAEHKYGLRMTSRSGWEEFFKKLGKASVTLELLQNKIGNTVTLNLNDPILSNNKGPAFILYNCARLSRLFKEFDKRVESKTYPALPPIETVDFAVLVEEEAWELFYVYVLQFPGCIRNCLRDIAQCKIHPHHLIRHLAGLCNVFSVYYRRVKILMEPRDHLFPQVFAKIYLLKSLEQTMHTALRLLNIQPVRQM